MNLKKICFVLSFIICGAIVSGQNLVSKRDPKACTDIAKKILNSFEQANYSAIPVYFDTKLKEGLTPSKLEASWKDIIRQLGNYKGIRETRSEMFVGSTIIYCVCTFGEDWPVDFKTVYNGAGKITGLFFLPHLDPLPGKDTLPQH